MNAILSQSVKDKAVALGFTACGIAAASSLSEEQRRFEHALEKGYHAQMTYLERDVTKRFSPEQLMPGCRSLVVCLYHYTIDEKPAMTYRIARYAHLQDYHLFMKEKLQQLAEHIHGEESRDGYKLVVDTSAISEKNWAVKAGLGSIGKNSLFRDMHGSYCFIGIILTTMELEKDPRTILPDCGDCTLCIKACPTNALEIPYQVNANRCISYHTIESKTEDYQDINKGSWVFGCDICQEVCPHNHSHMVNPDALNQKSLFLHLRDEDMENMDENKFKYFFKGSSLERRKFDRVKKEIDRVRKDK